METKWYYLFKRKLSTRKKNMVSLYTMKVYTCVEIYHLESESIVKAIEIRIKNYRNTIIEGE